MKAQLTFANLVTEERTRVGQPWKWTSCLIETLQRFHALVAIKIEYSQTSLSQTQWDRGKSFELQRNQDIEVKLQKEAMVWTSNSLQCIHHIQEINIQAVFVVHRCIRMFDIFSFLFHLSHSLRWKIRKCL